MKRFAALAVALGALAAPALAHAAKPPIARPNPVVYPVRLDYADPLLGPDGKPATLAPLSQSVIMAATRDQAYLAFERQDDLGGFTPAPIGKLALSSGGRDVLSPGTHKPQIPLFQQAAGGKVSSFTFTGSPPSGPTPPPDNGKGPGVTPPPPPTPGNTVPPANQGFGGKPNGAGGRGGVPPPPTTTTRGAGGTTTTTKPPPPPPPTTTGSTTAPTTTAPTTTTPTTTTGGGGGGGGCSGASCASGSCGVPGVQIDSTPPGCVIAISNAAPGDSASEVMTITNTSDTPYTLSLKATGLNNNHLWQDLQMAVWDTSGAPPPVFPTLVSWMSGFHSGFVPTLNPGDVRQIEIDLFLPTTAGNADQGKTAVIAFVWHAQG
jgi:hypothetical protein